MDKKLPGGFFILKTGFEIDLECFQQVVAVSFIISQKIHEFLFTKFQKICLGCKGIKQIKYRNIIVGIRTTVLIKFTQFQCTLCLCIIMGQLHNVSEVIADAGKKIIAIQNIQQLCLGILTLCTIAAVYADNITLVSEGNGARESWTESR